MFTRWQANRICRRILPGYLTQLDHRRNKPMSRLEVRWCPRLRTWVTCHILPMLDARYIQLDSHRAELYLQSQVDACVQAFCDYLRIREQFDPCYGDWPGVAHVSHSALLRWLLLGRSPTTLPPPVLYGYPRHWLATGEMGMTVDVSEARDGSLTIGQNAEDFQWLDRQRRIVLHDPSQHRYRIDQGVMHRLVRAENRVSDHSNRTMILDHQD